MNKETSEYYTRIEDLEDELPDRVINDLNQLRNEDDTSSIFSMENTGVISQKSNMYSIIGDVIVVFLIVVFVLNKRFIKFVGEYDVNLPKNIIMAIISSFLYSIYKIILSIY